MQPASFILIVTRRRFDMWSFYLHWCVCRLDAVVNIMQCFAGTWNPASCNWPRTANKSQWNFHFGRLVSHEKDHFVKKWLEIHLFTWLQRDGLNSLMDIMAVGIEIEFSFSAIFGKGRIQLVLYEVRRVRLPFYCQFPKWRTFLGIFGVQGIF